MKNWFSKKKEVKIEKDTYFELKRYDSENRLIYHQIENNYSIHFEYDLVWRDKPSVVRYKYLENFKNENLKDSVPFPKEKKFFYDKNGNLVLITYSNGSKHEYEYDERGNLIREYVEHIRRYSV